MIAYHVTTSENYKSIEKDGLVPKIGPRSADLGEIEPKIYFFPDKISCVDALSNWLGEEFDEDDSLLILEVDISKFNKQSEVGYEVTVNEPVPNYCIHKVFSESEFEKSMIVKEIKKNRFKP